MFIIIIFIIITLQLGSTGTKHVCYDVLTIYCIRALIGYAQITLI